MPFYNPISIKISKTPAIVYLDQGIEKIIERKLSAIEKHLTELCRKNPLPEGTDYLIVFLWSENESVMTDLWIFSKTDSWGSGPLNDARIFDGFGRTTEIGIGSGNTLIVLGREEELRRKSKSLQEYLSGPRPKLPDYLLIGEASPE